MSSPQISSFFSVLEAAPDPKAPGYIKIRKSDQDLRRKREAIFEEAHHEGFQSGYDDGYRMGAKKGREEGYAQANAEAHALRQAELVQFKAGMQRAIDSVQTGLGNWITLAEAELEEVAIEIAERILNTQLQMDRSNVTSIVKAAMGEITHSGEARIRVNPYDSEVLRQYKDEIQSVAPSVRNLVIADDQTVESGCIIETDGGLVEARLVHQLQVLQNTLRKAA